MTLGRSHFILSKTRLTNRNWGCLHRKLPTAFIFSLSKQFFVCFLCNTLTDVTPLSADIFLI
jgi:hypothetical protein